MVTGIVGPATGVLELECDVGIDNQTLMNPVRVDRIQGDTLYLVDGRVVLLDRTANCSLEEVIAESDYEVEIDSKDGVNAMIWCERKGNDSRRRGAGTLRIPLIVNRYNMNYRLPLAPATIVAGEPASNTIPASPLSLQPDSIKKVP